ncbi:hypothetical protein [Actinophytocola sp.]|uniref:hypothetical protein n=1 Tax=Actinophytocola sp. TaxID=1872138 RepID=UPI002EDAADDD
MIVATSGATAGRVVKVQRHPRGRRIWLAHIDLGDGNAPAQIVFGGQYVLGRDELVPVAPPGARVVDRAGDGTLRTRKIRRRRFRGERSHGMLCSFDELGWSEHGGQDEVAILRAVTPGQNLDDLSVEERRELVGSPRGRGQKLRVLVMWVSSLRPLQLNRSRELKLAMTS